MKRLILTVTNLGTDREGEVIHYEVQAGTQLLIGDFVGKSATPYNRCIAEVPDDVTASLNTPDARLALSIED
jgi:hypothetical protein